jgi:hypothetical protein
MTKKQNKLVKELMLTFKVGKIYLFKTDGEDCWSPSGFPGIKMKSPHYYAKVVGHMLDDDPGVIVIPLGVKFPDIFPKNLTTEYLEEAFLNSEKCNGDTRIWNYISKMSLENLTLYRFNENKKDKLKYDKNGNVISDCIEYDDF